MTRQSGAIIALTAVVSFLLGLVAATTQPPGPASELPAPATPRLARTIDAMGPIPALGPVGGGVADFAAVAARVNPAVVTVETVSRSNGAVSRPRRPGEPGTPSEGSGSGFIIDETGHILTNYHVVRGADRITVSLTDGRAFRAALVGIDPAIDVALLHIDVPEPLPAAELGDSGTLRVGEWVCAIGNPLGVYVHSVTVGVVSFLGRKIFDSSLDSYIQTDAAISIGSSGGPLVNARGEVVGITTAVSVQAMSVGFAVPISQVLDVLPQLQENGRVARGYLGVGLTAVTPGLRDALGLAPAAGALVQDVAPDTPAARAGLRAYDVIVGIDGRPVGSDEALLRDIATRLPGTIADLELWRDGASQRVTVKLSIRPVQESGDRQPPSGDAIPTWQDLMPLGIRVRELDEAATEELRIPGWIKGVLVVEVDPASPARLAQMRSNHVILEVNRHPVRSVADYRAAVGALESGSTAALLVYDRTTGQRVICAVPVDGP